MNGGDVKGAFITRQKSKTLNDEWYFLKVDTCAHVPYLEGCSRPVAASYFPVAEVFRWIHATGLTQNQAPCEFSSVSPN